MRSFAAFLLGFISCGMLIAAVGFFAKSRADDWIVGSGVAVHLDGGSHCNSFTTGLGYEHANTSVGFYRNSNCKWSTYIAQVYTPIRIGALRLGALSGGVTGYNRTITPVAGFAASIEGERYGLNIVYVPPFSGSGNVLWFSLKRRW